MKDCCEDAADTAAAAADAEDAFDFADEGRGLRVGLLFVVPATMSPLPLFTWRVGVGTRLPPL